MYKLVISIVIIVVLIITENDLGELEEDSFSFLYPPPRRKN